MIPSPLPDPLPLLQAASMDTVMAALVAVPQELRQQPDLQVVMLRDRRRLLLLESGALRQSFPVAIGMPGWETPTGRFKVLQKIDTPVWVLPVSGDRVADQSSANPLAATGLGFNVIAVAVMPTTVINGSRLRAAPALDFMGHPIAGRWVGLCPTAVFAS
jgi:hypothetical protein